jgi:hypothetical protein
MHHDQIKESYIPLNNYISNYIIKLHEQEYITAFKYNKNPDTPTNSFFTIGFFYF